MRTARRSGLLAAHAGGRPQLRHQGLCQGHPQPAGDAACGTEEEALGHRRAHEAGTGTGTTTGAAPGDFRNLVTNPNGRWSVGKSGTTVTTNFNNPRSPVQYHARQNPQSQFVLPAGFRPTATVPHSVTGTQVRENRKPVPTPPPSPLT